MMYGGSNPIRFCRRFDGIAVCRWMALLRRPGPHRGAAIPSKTASSRVARCRCAGLSYMRVDRMRPVGSSGSHSGFRHRGEGGPVGRESFGARRTNDITFRPSDFRPGGPILAAGLRRRLDCLAGHPSRRKTRVKPRAAACSVAAHALEECTTWREVCRRLRVRSLPCGNRRYVSPAPNGTLSHPDRRCC